MAARRQPRNALHKGFFPIYIASVLCYTMSVSRNRGKMKEKKDGYQIWQRCRENRDAEGVSAQEGAEGPQGQDDCGAWIRHPGSWPGAQHARQRHQRDCGPAQVHKGQFQLEARHQGRLGAGQDALLHRGGGPEGRHRDDAHVRRFAACDLEVDRKVRHARKGALLLPRLRLRLQQAHGHQAAEGRRA